MDEKTDVAVIGGGPCGSFAAFTAAKLGAEVVVCEEHKAVGSPVHCPAHVSISGLKRLGLDLPQKVVENTINGAVFYSGSGKELEVRCTTPVSLVLNRKLFDEYLSNLATKAGVKYRLQSRVKSILFNSNCATGVVVGKGKVEEILASRIVIDAEGCSSILLKRSGISTLNTSMIVRGIHAEVDSIEEVNIDTVEVYLGRRYAPGFYAWIIPKKDGSAKIGLATSIGNPREHLHHFMKKHPIASKKLRKSEITKLSLHPISLGRAIPKTYYNGLLVVGDAASQIKSTTGGGIIFGLLCSRIAGEVANESLQKNALGESFMSQYQDRWTKLIGFDLLAMRKLRKMLNRIPDEKMDNIISLCSKFGLKKILGKINDLDFEGRSLIRMFRYPPVLAVAAYFIFSYLIGKPLFRAHEEQVW